MRDLLVEVFGNFSKWIVLTHIVSSMLLLGSLVAMRGIVTPLLRLHAHKKEGLAQAVMVVSMYLKFVTVVMLVMILSSILMSVGLGFRYGDPVTYVLIHIKEALWTFIAFNFAYAFWKYLCAKRALAKDEPIETRENLVLIFYYLIPLNAFLSIVAAYFGVTVRGY